MFKTNPGSLLVVNVGMVWVLGGLWDGGCKVGEFLKGRFCLGKTLSFRGDRLLQMLFYLYNMTQSSVDPKLVIPSTKGS